jgi:DNA-binding response OmpR family regulator
MRICLNMISVSDKCCVFCYRADFIAKVNHYLMSECDNNAYQRRTMRILTIEDDDAVASALQESLRSSYIVDRASTGADGLSQIKGGRYDVIMLDLHLTDMSGLDVCRAIKDSQPDTPVLILSGDNAVMNKIALLDAGAEDYLTKPFSLGELKARLRTIIRRKGAKRTTATHLVVGELRMDLSRLTVTRGETAIALSYAWGENQEMWTNTVDVHIKFLRDKIDRPFDWPLIITVHGLGYKIESSAGVPSET